MLRRDCSSEARIVGSAGFASANSPFSSASPDKEL